jgi:hypothetical protein
MSPGSSFAFAFAADIDSQQSLSLCFSDVPPSVYVSVFLFPAMSRCHISCWTCSAALLPQCHAIRTSVDDFARYQFHGRFREAAQLLELSD